MKEEIVIDSNFLKMNWLWNFLKNKYLIMNNEKASTLVRGTPIVKLSKNSSTLVRGTPIIKLSKNKASILVRGTPVIEIKNKLI